MKVGARGRDVTVGAGRNGWDLDRDRPRRGRERIDVELRDRTQDLSDSGKGSRRGVVREGSRRQQPRTPVRDQVWNRRAAAAGGPGWEAWGGMWRGP